ncbi:MAG: guanylate kinase [Bacteroidetes bacterium]|nr:guanylate kinase [Bacteroidota bacterium]
MSGKLFLFAAPSGAGKSTIVKNLLTKFDELNFSISACTRKRREGEVDGVDYHFMTAEKFKEKISNNDFLEWEEVYPRNFYGTLKKDVEEILGSGHHVIFDIDVQGALSIKEFYTDQALSIFVMPPSMDKLIERLKRRATEDPESLERRIKKASDEMGYSDRFDEVVVNDDLDEALEKSYKLVLNFINS